MDEASIDATIADLKHMYINRAMQQAMTKCERVNLDFRYTFGISENHRLVHALCIFFQSHRIRNLFGNAARF